MYLFINCCNFRASYLLYHKCLYTTINKQDSIQQGNCSFTRLVTITQTSPTNIPTSHFIALFSWTQLVFQSLAFTVVLTRNVKSNNIYIAICCCILLTSSVTKAAVLAFWQSFIIRCTRTLTRSISNHLVL